MRKKLLSKVRVEGKEILQKVRGLGRRGQELETQKTWEARKEVRT